MRLGQLCTALWVVFAGVAVAGFGGVKQAHAAPSLILLEDNGSSNPLYRQVIESLGAVIVVDNLGHYYDHIDILTGSLAHRDALFEQIRKRGQKGIVDVVILTHGSNKRLTLATGNITDQDIRAAGPLPGLRLVYMMACYGASLESAWRDAGAQVVVGHQDINSLSGFFFPRFLRRWAEGASVRDAAEDAYRFSWGTALMLSNYIKDSKDYLSSVGVSRSEPVIQGVDLDRFGHAFPEHSLTIAPLSGQTPGASFVSQPAAYEHTDFERLGISLLGTMIPQAVLNVDAIPSAQKLVDRIQNVAWDQLQDSFPNPIVGLPGLGLPELPTEDGQQIWIDGEAIRYFLASLRDYAGDKLGQVLDRVQGVRLVRQGEALNVGVYFDGAFDIALQDRSQTPHWRPYSLHLPKAVRFSARMLESILTITGLDQGSDALNLKINMPALPDSVWVRTVSVNLSDGKARVEAGVLGDKVTVIANGEILARKFDGVDVWETIKRNIGLLIFPTLDFRVL